MYQKILIVCVGNICRSPTGERLLQKKLPERQIASAGIRALTGNDADFQAIKTALRHGVVIAGHTARQLTVDMCRQADLILVMEPAHIEAVADILPAARSKTMLFGQWLHKKASSTLTAKAMKCLKPCLSSLKKPPHFGQKNFSTPQIAEPQETFPYVDKKCFPKSRRRPG